MYLKGGVKKKGDIFIIFRGTKHFISQVVGMKIDRKYIRIIVSDGLEMK